MLTESGNYDCYCLPDVSQGLILECNVVYGERSADGSFIEYFYNNGEAMVFAKDNSTGLYTPTETSWYDWEDNDKAATSESQSFVLDADDSTQMSSCFIGSVCNGTTPLPACQICPDGQSAFYDYECDTVTCDESYTGTFLFGLHIDPSMGPFTPAIEEEDTPTCAPEGTTTVNEFCGDTLRSIETKFAELFAQYVPVFALQEDGFTCACAEPENDTFQVTCTGTFESLSGDPDFPDGPVSFGLEDYIVFQRKSSTSTYWVPSAMGFSDESGYAESYQISLEQRGIYDCNIGGCNPSFCSLCADGLSLTDSCFPLITCEEEIVGSFWALYMDQIVATEICPPLSSESPSAMPSESASGTPPSSVAWSRNPTIVSAIISALVSIMFVAQK